MGKLKNRRHEIFATELAAGAPMLSAFLAAGYKESYSARFNASRLKNTPAVRERIDELQAEFSRSTFVKLEWIQHQLVSIIEGRADSVVRNDGEKEIRERDRLGALAMLGKTIGAFTTQVALKGELEVNTQLNAEFEAFFCTLSVDDRRALIDELHQAAEAGRAREADEYEARMARLDRRQQEIVGRIAAEQRQNEPAEPAPSVTSDNRNSRR